MLHSEEFVRAVHAERTRDLERAANERRLLEPIEAPTPARLPDGKSRITATTGREPCGDSAGVPA